MVREYVRDKVVKMVKMAHRERRKCAIFSVCLKRKGVRVSEWERECGGRETDWIGFIGFREGEEGTEKEVLAFHFIAFHSLICWLVDGKLNLEKEFGNASYALLLLLLLSYL